MDDALVEKVARAIAAKQGYDPDGGARTQGLSPYHNKVAWEFFKDDALAAIAAMREAGWTPPNNSAQPFTDNTTPEDFDKFMAEIQKKPATSEGAG